MSIEVNKNGNPEKKVVVEVNVANIMKYICISNVLIVAIVFGSKIFSQLFDSKSI